MTNRTQLAIATLTALFAVTGLAQPSEPTAEQRQKMRESQSKMAEMHTKMAACLDSEKTVAQCRQEMSEQCAASFGGACPMDIGPKPGRGPGGGWGPGMMQHGPCFDWKPEATPGDKKTQ